MHNFVLEMSEFLHDIASPLSVLTLCIPEIEKCLESEKSAQNPKVRELLQLSQAALKEAKTELKTARQRIDFLEEKRD